MPRFLAPETNGDFRYLEGTYALMIEGPEIDPDSKNRPPLMQAFISLDEKVDRCVISERLAWEFYPPIAEGEVLFLTLIEENLDNGTTDRYKLGIPVTFTTDPDTIRIPLSYLLCMFDIAEQPLDEEAALPGISEKALILQLRKCVRSMPDDTAEFVHS